MEQSLIVFILLVCFLSLTLSHIHACVKNKSKYESTLNDNVEVKVVLGLVIYNKSQYIKCNTGIWPTQLRRQQPDHTGFSG